MQFDGDHSRVAALKVLLRKASTVKANIPPAAYQFGMVVFNGSIASNDSTYSKTNQNPSFPNHTGANKSAKSNYLALLFTILLKRYFWHAINALAASLLGFGVFSDAYSKGQNNHPLTAACLFGK